MNQVPPDRVADIHQARSPAEPRRLAMRLHVARAFALLVAAVMLVDAAPASWTWLARPKQAVAFVIGRIGLWQGEWSMFAPDPALNNGCFAAEIKHADGTQSQWNSPYWHQADSADKFLRFRYLNYFNRLANVWGDASREEFADYLARQSDVPVASINLYHSRMRLILPDDGTLPQRDEVEWMFSSESVAKRSYPQSGSMPDSSQQIEPQQR